MPYLEPERVLERFSEFALEEIRPAIDDEFLQGQVGSMASTLRFLSMELVSKANAIDRQHDALRTALDEIAATVDDEVVAASVETARDEITDAADDDPAALESTLLDASNDVLAAIDEGLTGDAARAARRPMYEFLDTRVQTQLEMMGRQRE